MKEYKVIESGKANAEQNMNDMEINNVSVK